MNHWHAIDGFEADAVDYLLKPFNLTRFQKAITKTATWLASTKIADAKTASSYLYIHEDYKMVKIALNEIMYMEALDDYVKIYNDTKSYLTLLSMKKMLEKLPEKQFIRIHRSYIVATEKIIYLQFRKLGLINEIELPVGDTYQSEIRDFKK